MSNVKTIEVKSFDIEGFEDLSAAEMEMVDGGWQDSVAEEVIKLLLKAMQAQISYEKELFYSGALTNSPGYNPMLVHVGLQPNPSPSTAAASRKA